MKRTKLMALLLCLTMCFVLVAGCSGSGSGATEAPAATEAPESGGEETAAPEDEGESASGFVEVQLPLTETEEELSLWLRLSPFLIMYNINDMSTTTFYTEMEARTGVHVNITSVPIFMAVEQFNIMMAGGEYTDMIDSFALLYTDGVDHAIDDGIIVDMNEFLDDWMPNYKAALDTDPQFWQDSLSADGRLAQANTLMATDEGVTVGMVIRQDWLEDVGMERPVTYDDYYNVLKAFQTELGKSGAFNISYLGATVNVTGGYETVGFYTDDEEMQPFMNIDGVASFGPSNEGYRKYLETMSQWYAEGLIFPDYITDSSQDLMQTAIANDEMGVFSYNRDDILRMQESARTIDADAYFVGSYDIRETADQEVHVRYPAQKVIDGIAISADCANIELAARWLDYCYSEEGSILCNYGVEGEGLQYDENGNPGYTDLVLHNPDMTSIACTAIYSKYGGAMLMDGRRNFGSYDEQLQEIINFWGESADMDYMYPAKARMTTDESETVSTYMEDIRSYVTEMTNRFIVGDETLNDETWSEYLETLDALGLQEVLDVKQTALDRYIALGESLA